LAPATKFKPHEEQDLFEMEEDWQKEWQGMPEFDQKDLTPFKTVYVHFHDLEGMQAFARFVDQPVTLDTRSIWYPKAEIGRIADKRYSDGGESFECPSCGKSRDSASEATHCDNPNCEESMPL